MRLELRGVLISALTGPCGRAEGVVGGELAISLVMPLGQTKREECSRQVKAWIHRVATR